jgi:IS5 family transposase
MNNEDNLAEEKAKRKRQRRRVSFSDNVAHFQMEERQLFTNWRERVAAILAKKVCRNSISLLNLFIYFNLA